MARSRFDACKRRLTLGQQYSHQYDAPFTPRIRTRNHPAPREINVTGSTDQEGLKKMLV